MTEINRHVTPSGVNSTAFYEQLLVMTELTTFVNQRRDSHDEDTRVYQSFDAFLSGRLRSEHVDGDGFLSAWRRYHPVLKRSARVAKLSAQLSQELSGLVDAYADYQRIMQALPAQRAAKAERKAGRRGAVSELTAKSLHKSATAFAPAPAGTDQQAAAEAAARPSVRGVGDLWEQQQHRRGA